MDLHRDKSDFILGGILKLIILSSLFFPCYTEAGYFAQKLVLPIIFAAAFAVFALKRKKHDSHCKFLTVMTLLIVCYNILSLFCNIKYTHWYWNQINKTLCFGFLIFLLWKVDKEFIKKQKINEFLLLSIIISAVLSITLCLIGEKAMEFADFNVTVLSVGNEKWFQWIYGHKSNLGLMNVLFLIFTLKYKDMIKNRYLQAGVILLLAISLFQSESMTSIIGGIIVFFGYLANRISWKDIFADKKKRKLLFFCAGIMLAAGFASFFVLISVRNVSSIGGRTVIWPASIRTIMENPYGNVLKNTAIQLSEVKAVYNPHNYFLAELFFYSIPAGICFVLIFGCMIAYCIWINKNLYALGVWAALLIILNMDSSLSIIQLPIFLYIIYAVFLCKEDLQ